MKLSELAAHQRLHDHFSRAYPQLSRWLLLLQLYTIICKWRTFSVQQKSNTLELIFILNIRKNLMRFCLTFPFLLLHPLELPFEYHGRHIFSFPWSYQIRLHFLLLWHQLDESIADGQQPFKNLHIFMFSFKKAERVYFWDRLTWLPQPWELRLFPHWKDSGQNNWTFQLARFQEGLWNAPICFPTNFTFHTWPQNTISVLFDTLCLLIQPVTASISVPSPPAIRIASQSDTTSRISLAWPSPSVLMTLTLKLL